jgi:hypothetical protein
MFRIRQAVLIGCTVLILMAMRYVPWSLRFLRLPAQEVRVLYAWIWSRPQFVPVKKAPDPSLPTWFEDDPRLVQVPAVPKLSQIGLELTAIVAAGAFLNLAQGSNGRKL